MPSIGAIEGMGPRNAARLRRAGIRTTEALLRRASTRGGRAELGEETGLYETQLLEWVNLADLMRISGVGSEYSDLLEAVGVSSVRELRRRSPQSLLKKMAAINEQKRLVRRLPTLRMVEGWVQQAKQTEPAVKH
ncbi:MAG: DUF4332 domain-containing protein [Actinomycetota bacterium]|nr:DUF4332 domain-containing protein [Actinomycetota bacterium]